MLKFTFKFFVGCVICLAGISHSLTRPPTPTITNASYSDGKITIEGSMDSAEQCHAVLLTDLSASLINAYESGSSLRPLEGAAVSWAENDFPIVVPLGSQSVERYFIAVAASKLEDKKRVFSPWKILADNSTGLPIAISTSDADKRENLISRARNIDAKNPNKVLIDFTFSLKTATAFSCRFELKQGSNVLLSLGNMGSIAGAKTDLINALNDTTGIGDSLIIVSASGDNNLYKIYQMVDLSLSSDLRATIIDNNGLVIDTMDRTVGTYSDDGYMDIFSTISALARMPDGTTNPFYPTSIPAANDSTKLNLLIAAMLDLSIAHNSPLPESNEQKQGIQTNYMQFMDNIAGNWTTLRTATRGIGRLRAIHERVLEQNKGEIVDPVYVYSRGSLLEYGQYEETQKRKNYAFYKAYSRLHCDLQRPVYCSLLTGVGVMFRISQDVALYKADFTNPAKIFDTAFLSGDASRRRIIIPANDTLLDNIATDGLWVQGVGTPEKKSYYTGLAAVRLPIQIAGSIGIDTSFSINNEQAVNGDNHGTLLPRIERSVIKMHVLKPNAQGGVDTLYNVEKPQVLLHGQKRIVEVDTNFCRGVLEFKEQGTPEQLANIDITTIDRNKVLIEDKATGVYQFLIVVSAFAGTTDETEKQQGLVAVENFETSKLGFRDIQNSNYEVVTVEDDVVELAIEPDDSKWLPIAERDGNVVFNVANCPKMKIYKNYVSPSSPGNLVLDASQAVNDVIEMEWDVYEGKFLREVSGGAILDKLTIVSSEGGFEQLAIKMNNGKTPLEEFVNITRIKAKKIEFKQGGKIVPYGQIFMNKANGANGAEVPVEVNIAFETNSRRMLPTVSQVNEYYNVSLSFYSAGNKFEDPMYTNANRPIALLPKKLCADWELWKDGAIENAKKYEVKKDGTTLSDYSVWAEIEVKPLAHIDNTANIPTDWSTFSMDIATGDRASAMDGDVFDNRNRAFGIARFINHRKNGKGIGENMVYGTTWTTYAFDALSDPIKWSNCYIYKGGVIFLSVNGGKKDHEESRLVYPKQAEMFFQSGHGMHEQQAAIYLGDYQYSDILGDFDFPRFFKLKDDTTDAAYMDNTKEIRDVLNEHWGSAAKTIKVAILNSCYNGNVTIINNTYPTNIWNDVLPTPDKYDNYWITDPRNDGRGNNIFKWFEVMGKNGTICGWGQSTTYKADGTMDKMYGRRGATGIFTRSDKAKGQSPADLQNGGWFTKEVMIEFNNNFNPYMTSIEVADTWVKAVAKIINDKKYTDDNNTFNAVSLGIDKSISPNIVKVFGLKMRKDAMTKKYVATVEEIASCQLVP